MSLVTLVHPRISNYGGPAKELELIEKFDIEVTNEGAEPVKTINRRRVAIGHQKGIIMVKGSFDTRVGIQQELDWVGLCKRMREFDLSYEEAESGRSYVLRRMLITAVKPANEPDGKYTHSVEFTALQHDDEQ